MVKKTTKKIFTLETKYGSFRCVFEPEKDMGGYAVEAQGLPGAISWGKNLSEAKRMIMQAIEGAIEAHAIVEAERKGIVLIQNNRRSALVT